MTKNISIKVFLLVFSGIIFFHFTQKTKKQHNQKNPLALPLTNKKSPPIAKKEEPNIKPRTPSSTLSPSPTDKLTPLPLHEIDSLMSNIDERIRNDVQLKFVRDDAPFRITQLSYNGTPIQNSYIKWEKHGKKYQLIAGSIPEIETREGDFHRYNLSQIKEELKESNDQIAEVEEHQLTWVAQEKVLTPYAILLVKGHTDADRISYIEYWHYNLENGQTEKKVAAGRR